MDVKGESLFDAIEQDIRRSFADAWKLAGSGATERELLEMVMRDLRGRANPAHVRRVIAESFPS